MMETKVKSALAIQGVPLAEITQLLDRWFNWVQDNWPATRNVPEVHDLMNATKQLGKRVEDGQYKRNQQDIDWGV